MKNTLTEKDLNMLQQDSLQDNEVYFSNGIVKEDENGDIIYTEEAQDKFNDLYAKYSKIIESTIV